MGDVLKKLKKSVIVLCIIEVILAIGSIVFFPMNGYNSSKVYSKFFILMAVQIISYFIVKKMSNGKELNSKAITVFWIMSIIILVIILIMNYNYVFLTNHMFEITI